MKFPVNSLIRSRHAFPHVVPNHVIASFLSRNCLHSPGNFPTFFPVIGTGEWFAPDSPLRQKVVQSEDVLYRTFRRYSLLSFKASSKHCHQAYTPASSGEELLEAAYSVFEQQCLIDRALSQIDLSPSSITGAADRSYSRCSRVAKGSWVTEIDLHIRRDTELRTGSRVQPRGPSSAIDARRRVTCGFALRRLCDPP